MGCLTFLEWVCLPEGGVARLIKKEKKVVVGKSTDSIDVKDTSSVNYTITTLDS